MAEKQQLVIEASPREVLGKEVNKFRGQGLIPAVLYGHGVQAKSLFVPESLFEKVYKQAGESTIVKLKLTPNPAVGPELVEGVNVLIHDIQRHVTKDNITHIDFYQVKMTEKLTATVPLKFTGASSAVKELGGIMVHALSEVEVKSLPADLPHEIEVDVSGISNFEDVIRVADLKVDRSKVEILADPDAAVALVKPPRTEQELKDLEAAPAAVDVTTIEGVEKKETEPGVEESVAEDKGKEA